MSSRIFFLILVLLEVLMPATGDFFRDFQVTWSPSKVKILDGGEQLQLVLDSNSGSGFKSKEEYLFGNIHMQIKLVPGDSAGTVTAYYLSSQSAYHDELDFEFLGNSCGEPYIFQTNVFASGVGGGREQHIFLWFDPTADFHTYSVSWTKQQILFLVDGTPIRAFPNMEDFGMAYLDKQAMGVYSSIWNGDQWATRGGRVKIDWAHAPFIANYRNFSANACVATSGTTACSTAGSPSPFVALDAAKLAWVERNYMVYNYCIDHARYRITPCSMSIFI